MKKGWERKTLGELIQLISGQHIDSKDYNTDSRGVGYLTGPSDFGPLNPIITKWSEHPKVKARKGDILITVKGSGVGKINLLDQKEVAISRQLMAVRVMGADPQFVYSFLSSSFDHFQSESTGAAIPEISREQVLGLQIAVPPLAEQQRIVGILDEAFAGLATAKATAEKNLQNARALFESHLQSVFSQGSQSAAEGRGKGWVETTVGDEVEFAAGFAFKSTQYASDAAKGVRLLRGDNIMQGEFRWESAAYWPSGDTLAYERFRLEENDIVLAMDRPWVTAGLKIARVATEDLPCLQVQRTARLRVSARLSWRYLFHLLRSQRFVSYLLDGQTGLGVPHISGKQILAFQFSRPSLDEQKIIAAKLDALQKETQRLASLYQQKLLALEALKKSLLHQAFSGEL